MSDKSTRQTHEDALSFRRARESLSAHNYADALSRFSALAERGDANAWNHLGWLHMRGLGVPRNDSKAELCYSRAIELGNIDALFSLGRLHLRNRAAQKAFFYFLEAAENGSLPGTLWVGRLYLRGLGTEKDLMKAKAYLKKAAEQGHIQARLDYCAAQAKGMFGNAQRVAGIYGLAMAIPTLIKLAHSDPYGLRMRW